MNFYLSLSSITKKLIIATLAFLFYGYLCRLAGVYFFWESKSVGWVLFWVSVLFILLDRIKFKKREGKKGIFDKICIGITVLIILVKGLLFFVVPQTLAYGKAVDFIKLNPEIQEKIGPVKSVIIIPLGQYSISENQYGSSGQADLHFIVKGSKKYTDLNLLMRKDFNTDWQIKMVQ
jgi:hypothetical protein